MSKWLNTQNLWGFKMDFEIKPFVGAGPIKFGMTRDVVRRSLPGTMTSFKRTSSEPLVSDHFVDIGIIVSYKAPDIVEAIEFSPDSNPTFNGFRLFELSPEQLKELLLKHDLNLEIDSDGFTANGVGIGASILEGDEEDGCPAEITSIIVFEKGYYD